MGQWGISLFFPSQKSEITNRNRQLNAALLHETLLLPFQHG